MTTAVWRGIACSPDDRAPVYGFVADAEGMMFLPADGYTLEKVAAWQQRAQACGTPGMCGEDRVRAFHDGMAITIVDEGPDTSTDAAIDFVLGRLNEYAHDPNRSANAVLLPNPSSGPDGEGADASAAPKGANDRDARRDVVLPGGREYLTLTVAAQLVYALKERLTHSLVLDPYYIQWAPGGPGLQVEIVSDQYLPPEHQITDFGAARLRQLGFQPPNIDEPNWTMWLENEYTGMEVAEPLVMAILDVYRVPMADAILAVGHMPPPLHDPTPPRPHAVTQPARGATQGPDEPLIEPTGSALWPEDKPNREPRWPHDRVFLVGEPELGSPHRLRVVLGRVAVRLFQDESRLPLVEWLPGQVDVAQLWEGDARMGVAVTPATVERRRQRLNQVLARDFRQRRCAGRAASLSGYQDLLAILGRRMELPAGTTVTEFPTEIRYDHWVPRQLEVWRRRLEDLAKASPLSDAPVPVDDHPVPAAPTSDELRARAWEVERAISDVVVEVDGTWEPWPDAFERGEAGLILKQPPGRQLATRITVCGPHRTLEVTTDLGEFRASGWDAADLMSFDTRLVSVFAVSTGETADEDGRWLVHLVAQCSIDLDGLERPVPLRLVSDLTRRAAVATLLKLQSMAASPSGPTWPGAAFAPDRTALVSWLSVRWPHDIAPEVRATFGPTFHDSGLGTPWIPERVGSLTHERDWWWSGRAAPETQVLRPPDAYMFGPALDRLARDWRERFHLSHFGHGVNSYSINYEFVGSRVSLVAQAAWGGIYMDVDHAVSGVRALSSDLQLLERLADSIADWPSERGRLLVWASNFRGARGWRWLGEPAEDWRALTEPTAEEEEAVGDMDDLDTGIGPAIRLLEAMLADELGIPEDTTDYSAAFGG